MIEHKLIQPNNLISKLKRLRQSSHVSVNGWIALIYMLWLAAAEILTTFYAPIPGLALHGLLFVALLVQAALVNHLSQRRFFLALALVPLIHLLSLSIPQMLFPVIYRYAVIGVPLLLAVLLAARAAGLDVRMIGFTLRKIPSQILFGLTGFFLGYIEYMILRPAPMVNAPRLELIWLPALILMVFTGFLDELIFRGMLQYTALQQLGRFGIPYVAVIYALLQLGYYSALHLLLVLCVSLVFGWFVWRTGSIMGVILSHGLTNITLFLILPILIALPASPTIVPPNNISTVNSTPNGNSIYIPHPFTQEPTTKPFQLSIPLVMSIASPLEVTDQSSTSVNGQTPSPSDIPTNTPTTTSPTQEECVAPPGWVIYIVRTGDTLYGLSLALGISVHELQTSNCLTNPSLIFVGQHLYVPSSPP
jgi:membrane protease YdiL (CAAX protease family)/LysM repeat protein